MPRHDASDDWFADDTFWATSFDYMFPASRFQAAAGEFDAILALAGGEPERVLDVACGPGRHAIAAAQRGLVVTGVDRSAFLLGKARERAAAESVSVQWVHADMRDYAQEDSADLVLNVFSSFGYFEEDADNERVLRHAHRSLRAGGALVVDVMGKEVLARIFLESSVEDTPTGFVAQRRRVVEEWSQIENVWTFVEGEAVRTFGLRHWLYSGRELAQMLTRAGFADVQLYGDFDGAPYGPKASRLVAVAKKA